MTNDELSAWVTARIDTAIRRNLPIEAAIVVILVVMAGVGVFLLVSGSSAHRWELLASGAACEAAVGWPVASLLKIRRHNLMLQVLPGLIRTADTDDRKALIFQFIQKLMERL